jgi:hypothetical protein
MKHYVRTFNQIQLFVRQIAVSDIKAKEYGIISKYLISGIGDKTYSGEMVQKFSGNRINHPGGSHRERVWLYDWVIDDVHVTGSATSMNNAIAVLTDLIKERIANETPAQN